MDMFAGISNPVEPQQLVFVLLAVLAAAVLRAFTGFGFGLAAVPVFALFMPPTQAVVLSSSLTFAISLFSLRTYWGEYPVKSLLPMLAMALVGTAIGVTLLARLDARQFQLWVGIAVIATCLVLTRYRPRRRQPVVGTGSAAGLLSGVLNGVFAMPGPPVIIYALATQPDPARSRSLLMTFFLFASALALVLYALAGFFTPATPWLFVLAFPLMLLGDRVGYALFHRFAGRFYRRVAVLVLLALGVVVTTRSLV
jgi:uncharacterized membrane protein YfcA